MALALRKVSEFVRVLLRAWNKKDGGDVLKNIAQASTASGDGSNGKPALAGTEFSSPSQPANLQTTHGRPLNAARLRAVELATQLGFGGTGTRQRLEDTKTGLSDPGVHIDASRRRSSGRGGTAKTSSPGYGAAIFRLADGESDMARIAPHQVKKLPEIRCKTSSEVNRQRRPPISPPVDIAT